MKKSSQLETFLRTKSDQVRETEFHINHVSRKLGRPDTGPKKSERKMVQTETKPNL
jgi:hypothetical protein